MCDMCKIMKSKIKNYIEMTNYPMKPLNQKYTGNTGNFYQPKITSSTSLASLTMRPTEN